MGIFRGSEADAELEFDYGMRTLECDRFDLEDFVHEQNQWLNARGNRQRQLMFSYSEDMYKRAKANMVSVLSGKDGLSMESVAGALGYWLGAMLGNRDYRNAVVSKTIRAFTGNLILNNGDNKRDVSGATVADDRQSAIDRVRDFLFRSGCGTTLTPVTAASILFRINNEAVARSDDVVARYDHAVARHANDKKNAIENLGVMARAEHPVLEKLVAQRAMFADEAADECKGSPWARAEIPDIEDRIAELSELMPVEQEMRGRVEKQRGEVAALMARLSALDGADKALTDELRTRGVIGEKDTWEFLLRSVLVDNPTPEAEMRMSVALSELRDAVYEGGRNVASLEMLDFDDITDTLYRARSELGKLHTLEVSYDEKLGHMRDLVTFTVEGCTHDEHAKALGADFPAIVDAMEADVEVMKEVRHRHVAVMKEFLGCEYSDEQMDDVIEALRELYDECDTVLARASEEGYIPVRRGPDGTKQVDTSEIPTRETRKKLEAVFGSHWYDFEDESSSSTIALDYAAAVGALRSAFNIDTDWSEERARFERELRDVRDAYQRARDTLSRRMACDHVSEEDVGTVMMNTYARRAHFDPSVASRYAETSVMSNVGSGGRLDPVFRADPDTGVHVATGRYANSERGVVTSQVLEPCLVDSLDSVPDDNGMSRRMGDALRRFIDDLERDRGASLDDDTRRHIAAVALSDIADYSEALAAATDPAERMKVVPSDNLRYLAERSRAMRDLLMLVRKESEWSRPCRTAEHMNALWQYVCRQVATESGYGWCEREPPEPPEPESAARRRPYVSPLEDELEGDHSFEDSGLSL